MKESIFKDVGNKVTIELCQTYSKIGFNCVWNDGKDLTLVEKEKDLSGLADPSRSR